MDIEKSTILEIISDNGDSLQNGISAVLVFVVGILFHIIFVQEEMVFDILWSVVRVFTNDSKLLDRRKSSMDLL